MKAKISGKTIFVFCLSVYSALFFTGCIKNNVPPTASNTNSIRNIITSSTNAGLLDSMLIRSGLDSMFTYEGTFTFFAATDQAFAAAGITNSVFDNLSDSALKRIMLYNTLYPATLSTQFPAGPDAPVQTISGDSIFITYNGTSIYINGISLVSADLIATNGIIDAVSRLVLPPAGNFLQFAQSDTSFSYFNAALARTNDGETSVGNLLTNGNIYTLFLPNNDAFRAAGYATTSDITAADPDTLAKTLLYHIVPDRVFTSDFLVSKNQQTLVPNETISYGVFGSGVFGVKGTSNSSPIILVNSNIMTYKGVIHVIGQLLKP